MEKPDSASLPRKAVCLLSGGLDSATALYVAVRQGYEVTALTVFYGQSHVREIQSAKALAARLGLEHHTVNFALPWGGSSLIDKKMPIPQGRDEAAMSRDIPSTYVPARNSIFLAFAASLAEARGAEAIFIGANAIDYSGYPDCRPEFLNAFCEAIRRGTKAGVNGKNIRIEAPLVKLSKKAIVRLGESLQVPFEITWSCYVGGDIPCGECDSCILRKKGFEEAGIPDPLSHYAISSHR
ncbi:MAG TPA: 7-cyano-7-deazaguanine synthase QueC [Verrucomicrobiae bacterium]|jgi:7-cyano-7-deazaguanine synthase|nr:7-cyano-7-deazaguanine synthase QueC [Verrucomicrobiae bacterium]